MSIRLKLIASFAFSNLLAVALGAFVLTQMAAMSRSTDSLVSLSLPTLEKAASLQESISAYHAAQLAYIGATTDTQRDAIGSDLRQFEDYIAELLEQYAALESSRRERRALETLRASWQRYVAQFGIAALGPMARASQLSGGVGALAPSYEELRAASAGLRQVSRSQAASAASLATSAYDSARSVTIAVLAIVVMFGSVIGFSQALDISDGLRQLQAGTRRAAEGDLEQRLAIPAGDELGALAADFQQLMRALQLRDAEVAAQQQALGLRNAELERAYAELRANMAEREALSATVRAMSTPLIPLRRGVLVAPLVGLFDGERAAQFAESLLAAVERQGARSVIIDVTGLAMLDSPTAARLLETARAARLLGARTILVGVRPELAQSLVSLGVSLDDLVTRSDLQSGVEYAMGR